MMKHITTDGCTQKQQRCVPQGSKLTTITHTTIHTHTFSGSGLGGSGESSQVGGLMFRSNEAVAIDIERLCLTGTGGGSSMGCSVIHDYSTLTIIKQFAYLQFLLSHSEMTF